MDPGTYLAIGCAWVLYGLHEGEFSLGDPAVSQMAELLLVLLLWPIIVLIMLYGLWGDWK